RWKNLEHSQHRVRRIEDRLLTFLKVLVISKRQPFNQHRQRRRRSKETSGLSPDQLGQVRILLLRHRARSGRKGLRQIEEAELCRGEQRKLLGKARDMQPEHRKRL